MLQIFFAFCLVIVVLGFNTFGRKSVSKSVQRICNVLLIFGVTSIFASFIFFDSQYTYGLPRYHDKAINKYCGSHVDCPDGGYYCTEDKRCQLLQECLEFDNELHCECPLSTRNESMVGAPCVFQDFQQRYDSAFSKCGANLRCIKDEDAVRQNSTNDGKCAKKKGAAVPGICSPVSLCTSHADCKSRGPLANDFYCNLQGECQHVHLCYGRNDAVDCICPILGERDTYDIVFCNGGGDENSKAMEQYQLYYGAAGACPSWPFISTCLNYAALLDSKEREKMTCPDPGFGYCYSFVAGFQPAIAASLFLLFLQTLFLIWYTVNSFLVRKFAPRRCLKYGLFDMLPAYQQVVFRYSVTQMAWLLLTIAATFTERVGKQWFETASVQVVELIWFEIRLLHMFLVLFGRPTLSRRNLGYATLQWAVLTLMSEAFGLLVLVCGMYFVYDTPALAWDEAVRIAASGVLVPLFWPAFWLHRVYVKNLRGFGRRRAGRVLARTLVGVKIVILPLTICALLIPDLDKQVIITNYSLVLMVLWSVAAPVLILWLIRVDANYWRGSYQTDDATRGGALPNHFRSDPRYRELRRDMEGKVPLILLDDDAIETLATSDKEVLHRIIDFTHLELKEKLGEGSFATVYRGLYSPWSRDNIRAALENRQPTVVAVKVLQNSDVSEATIKSYVSETRIASSFDHPNVIKCVGVCICPPDLSIVQEFCSRGTLTDLLPQVQKFPWIKKLQLMCQMAQGLSYMHDAKHCIHRDIKPDNILVSEDWILKITDFGVSVSVAEKPSGMRRGLIGVITRMKRVFRRKGWMKTDNDAKSTLSVGTGSPAYMAPEIIRNYEEEERQSRAARAKKNKEDEEEGVSSEEQQEEKDHEEEKENFNPYAIDVFALGVTFWQCHTARTPYEDINSDFDMLKAVRSGTRRPLFLDHEKGNMPEDGLWKKLVEQMWAQEPGQRPTASEVVDELNRQIVQYEGEEEKKSIQ